MFYLVDKPVGISSFFALGKIKFILQAKKIGHTGTLDPLASGLLIVATEGSTKLIPFLDKARKTYEFSVDFSRISPSCDLGSEVTSISEEVFSLARSRLGLADIEAVLPEFRGKISQVPPIFSAVRIDGKRAYKMARSGAYVEIAPREVEVFSLDLLDFKFPIAKFRAEVSAGTYIRSIGRDIGKMLGELIEASLGGVITELRRTRIADWRVEDATARNEVTPETKPLPYEKLFPDFGILEVLEEHGGDFFLNGNILPLSAYKVIRKNANENPYFVKKGETFFFLAEIRDDMVHPNRGNIE